MARLKRHFDDDAVVELTGLVAFQNLSSKFNNALAVAPQGFCRMPRRPAAPRAAVDTDAATEHPRRADVS